MRSISESAVSLKDFAGLFVALVAVASAVLLLFNISWRQEEADLRIDHTREVYRDSQQIRVCTAQANTNLRNYLMTSNTKYMRLYGRYKESLLKEAVQLLEATRNPQIQSLLLLNLIPDLKSFLKASDNLLSTQTSQAAEAEALQKQEAADVQLNSALETLQGEQLQILQKRKDKVLDTTNAVAQARIFILLVACIAIIFSIFTLQTVMKKDKEKIESLQAAVNRTMQAEKEALEALAEAQKSNQLKTEFMSNISHEIRTPMTGILGLADLLCASDLKPPAKAYARTLFESSQQLLQVMNDLLNFSQLERSDVRVERKPFAIRQTVEEVATLAKAPAEEKNLSLSTFIDDTVPVIVNQDEEKVKQVLAALVSNGLKFTEEGAVQIAVESQDEDTIRVSVADTGIGIANQDLNKLFQPFVQVDGGIRRTYGGTGLSLTIAKRLVEMMGGQIGVLSQPGAGSIFWFTVQGARANE